MKAISSRGPCWSGGRRIPMQCECAVRLDVVDAEGISTLGSELVAEIQFFQITGSDHSLLFFFVWTWTSIVCFQRGKSFEFLWLFSTINNKMAFTGPDQLWGFSVSCGYLEKWATKELMRTVKYWFKSENTAFPCLKENIIGKQFTSLIWMLWGFRDKLWMWGSKSFGPEKLSSGLSLQLTRLPLLYYAVCIDLCESTGSLWGMSCSPSSAASIALPREILRAIRSNRLLTWSTGLSKRLFDSASLSCVRHRSAPSRWNACRNSWSWRSVRSHCGSCGLCMMSRENLIRQR